MPFCPCFGKKKNEKDQSTLEEKDMTQWTYVTTVEKSVEQDEENSPFLKRDKVEIEEANFVTSTPFNQNSAVPKKQNQLNQFGEDSRDSGDYRSQTLDNRRKFFRELYENIPPESKRARSEMYDEHLSSTLPTIARAEKFGKVKTMRPSSQSSTYDEQSKEASFPPPGPHLLRASPSPKPSDQSAKLQHGGFASSEFINELKAVAEGVSDRWAVAEEKRLSELELEIKESEKLIEVEKKSPSNIECQSDVNNFEGKNFFDPCFNNKAFFNEKYIVCQSDIDLDSSNSENLIKQNFFNESNFLSDKLEVETPTEQNFLQNTIITDSSTEFNFFENPPEPLPHQKPVIMITPECPRIDITFSDQILTDDNENYFKTNCQTEETLIQCSDNFTQNSCENDIETLTPSASEENLDKKSRFKKRQKSLKNKVKKWLDVNTYEEPESEDEIIDRLSTINPKVLFARGSVDITAELGEKKPEIYIEESSDTESQEEIVTSSDFEIDLNALSAQYCYQYNYPSPDPDEEEVIVDLLELMECRKSSMLSNSMEGRPDMVTASY